MIKCIIEKIFKTGLLVIAMSFTPLTCHALEQHEKLWLGVMYQTSLTQDHQWQAYIFPQFRFINQDNPWQAVFLEGAIGNQFSPLHSFWLGYRWTGHNPYNDFSQENRLFQQFISQTKLSVARFILRSRLEELQRTNQPSIAFRIRERLAAEFHSPLFEKALPYIFDEVFLQLNRTDYMPDAFVGENRLFLGFNLYSAEKTWWEIGYINQYQIKSPLQTQNQMSHIISVTYYFS